MKFLQSEFSLFFRFGKFALKYKKKIYIRNISDLGPESSISQNIRKTFFGKDIKSFQSAFFLLIKLGLKSVPGSPI